MTFCYNCGQQLDDGLEKYCPNCGKDLTGKVSTYGKDSINIHNTTGDVFGLGITGSGNIVGKNIVVEPETINASKQELDKIPISKYATSLKEFSDSLNQQFKGKQIPEEKIKEINNSLNELAKELQDVNPGEENDIRSEKRKTLFGKVGNVIRGVIKILPIAGTVTSIASSLFIPLTPFGGLIGGSVHNIVSSYIK